MHIQGKIIESKEYKLYDEERNLFYPIIENEQGTHMLAAKDLCMMNKLPKILSIGIDYLKIDGFLYTENQYDEIVGIYNNAIIDYYNNQEVDYEKLFEKIKNVTPDKSYNTGFYIKENY
jgi:putative protease